MENYENSTDISAEGAGQIMTASSLEPAPLTNRMSENDGGKAPGGHVETALVLQNGSSLFLSGTMFPEQP